MPRVGSKVMRITGAGVAVASTRLKVMLAYFDHSVMYLLTLFCWLVVPTVAPARYAYVIA